MAAAAPSASTVLTLYRGILRAHRTTLPRAMRTLGDAYVRDEFRRHRRASPAHAAAFVREWQAYHAQLLAAGPMAAHGRPLADDEVRSLSPEQQAQLEMLRRTATAADSDEWK